jgi:hypothetical protein
MRHDSNEPTRNGDLNKLACRCCDSHYTATNFNDPNEPTRNGDLNKLDEQCIPASSHNSEVDLSKTQMILLEKCTLGQSASLRLIDFD